MRKWADRTSLCADHRILTLQRVKPVVVRDEGVISLLTEIQTPTSSAGSVPQPDSWRPLSSSLATRKFDYRSQASARVFMSTPCGRQLIPESRLEACFAAVALARPDIETLYEQPAPITYFDFDGKAKRHWFDFLVVKTDGSRWMVAVKPAARATQRFRSEMSLIARQVSTDVAQGVWIITEAAVPPAAVSDARLLLSVRQDQDFEAYARLTELARTIPGAVAIKELASAVVGARSGFRAVVRLIAEGVLERVDASPLTPAAFVRPASGVQGQEGWR